MCSIKHISFICGDSRQIQLANLFAKNKFHVYTFGISSDKLSSNCIKCITLESTINHSDIIVFPFKIDSIPNINFNDIIPLLKNKTIFGGNISTEFVSNFHKYNIKFYDFFKVDYITRLNAIATAEGCIMHAINSSPYNIHGSNSLVIGYGNCGCVLAHKLRNLDSKVTVCCRNPYQGSCAICQGIDYINLEHLRNNLYQYQFIFNTVPAPILTKKYLDNVKIDAIIIDIASLPGGIDLEYAKMINLNAENYPGLPGIVSPISSAQILYDYIMDVLT